MLVIEFPGDYVGHRNFVDIDIHVQGTTAGHFFLWNHDL